MGHYWSEVRPDPDYVPPPKPPAKALVDKERVTLSRGVGAPLDECERVQYAIDYDDRVDNYWYKKGDPEGAGFRPIREIMTFDYQRSEEKIVSILEELVAVRMRTQRGGATMKRTVTYGPWEPISEVKEPYEGRY